MTIYLHIVSDEDCATPNSGDIRGGTRIWMRLSSQIKNHGNDMKCAFHMNKKEILNVSSKKFNGTHVMCETLPRDEGGRVHITLHKTDQNTIQSCRFTYFESCTDAQGSCYQSGFKVIAGETDTLIHTTHLTMTTTFESLTFLLL